MGATMSNNIPFKRTLSIILIFTLVLGICSCASPRQRPQSLISDVVLVEDNTYECKFKEMTFKFMLFLPEKMGSNTPLIIMMCGLGNNSLSFQNKTHMEETACPRGYAVCYVQPGQGTGGRGWDCGIVDPAEVDSLEYIVNLVIYLQDEYGLSKVKAFAAGFSNGGFMAHRVAAEASDTFLATASVAGVMASLVWDARPEKAEIGFLEIYGTIDNAVPQNGNGTADSSPHPAIEDTMDYWVSANGLSSSSTETLSDRAVITKYDSPFSRPQVWTVVVDEGEHVWPTVDYAGFDTNSLILDFFDQCS